MAGTALGSGATMMIKTCVCTYIADSLVEKMDKKTDD